ncbi:MAG: metal-dependent hydrolase [Sulfurimonas sp.]|jgi:inner membrane protein
MTAKGHMFLATALAYLPINYIANTYSHVEAAISLSMIVLGSLLPDIDEPKSYIGQKAFYLSYPLKLFGLKHRTITHWLITPVLIGLVGYYFVEHELLSLILLSIAFGIFAHDIGDLLTNGGINGFLFPFFRNTKIGLLPRVLRFETFSVTEMFFIILLIGFNAYFYSKILVQIV